MNENITMTEEAKKENDLDFSDEKLITWKSENRRIDKKS